MSAAGVMIAGAVFHVGRRHRRFARLTWWREKWAASCEGDVLARLSQTMDPELAMLLIARNPHVSKRHLGALAAIEDPHLQFALAAHPECPKWVLRNMARYGGLQLRICVAGRDRLPKSVQARLAVDRHVLVRQALAGNPAAKSRFQVLAALS